MKLILYWVFYCSSMDCKVYPSAGAISIDTERMVVQSYVKDAGIVTWKIDRYQVGYNADTHMVSDGILLISSGEYRSVMVIGENVIEQNIMGYGRILMIKNKYANRKLHPKKIQRFKRKAEERIERSQQTCWNQR